VKHNVYFDGKVQSMGLNTENGYATVGVISAGNYSFSTETEERMIIISGALDVKLPDEEWKLIKAGQEFKIKEKASFEVEAASDVSYICYYGTPLIT